MLGVTGTTLEKEVNAELVHKRRKGERARKEKELNVNAHKVERIPIDGNFTRCMDLLGYNQHAMRKDSIAIKKRVEKISKIYSELKEEVRWYNTLKMTFPNEYIKEKKLSFIGTGWEGSSSCTSFSFP